MPRFTIQYTNPDEPAADTDALCSLFAQSHSIRCVKAQAMQQSGQEHITEYIVETNWSIARLAGRIADLTANTPRKARFSIKPHQ